LEDVAVLREKAARANVLDREPDFARDVLVAMARAAPAARSVFGRSGVMELEIGEGQAPEEVFRDVFLVLMEEDGKAPPETPFDKRHGLLRETIDGLENRFAQDFRRLGRRGVLGFGFFSRLADLIAPLVVAPLDETTPPHKRAHIAAQRLCAAIKKEVQDARAGARSKPREEEELRRATQADASVIATSPKRTPAPETRKKRGPKVRYVDAEDEKLVRDWHASEQTKKQFERARGLKQGDVRRAQDRRKARTKTPRHRSAR
jgi:hypothetical protein